MTDARRVRRRAGGAAADDAPGVRGSDGAVANGIPSTGGIDGVAGTASFVGIAAGVVAVTASLAAAVVVGSPAGGAGATPPVVGAATLLTMRRDRRGRGKLPPTDSADDSPPIVSTGDIDTGVEASRAIAA